MEPVQFLLLSGVEWGLSCSSLEHKLLGIKSEAILKSERAPHSAYTCSGVSTSIFS